MVSSAFLALPLSLEKVGEVLKLKRQKEKEGKDLIKFFSTCKKGRHEAEDYPEKWEAFKRYNIRDVEVEMSIVEKLSRFPGPAEIWEEYQAAQKINGRGVRIDTVLVINAIEVNKESRRIAIECLKEIA